MFKWNLRQRSYRSGGCSHRLYQKLAKAGADLRLGCFQFATKSAPAVVCRLLRPGPLAVLETGGMVRRLFTTTESVFLEHPGNCESHPQRSGWPFQVVSLPCRLSYQGTLANICRRPSPQPYSSIQSGSLDSLMSCTNDANPVCVR